MGFLDSDYGVGQHFPTPGGARWAADLNLVSRLVRLYGRNPNAEWLVCDSVAVPDEPDSRGFRADAAVWYSSQAADPEGIVRPLGLWANTYPAVVQKSSGTQSDPYKSKVVSAVKALPAFRQAPGDPQTWQADSGVLAQKVAMAGGNPVPAGSQILVVPFSTMSEQQLAGFKASSELIAVWRGGPAQGPMGTLVYDVTPQGELDQLRRARVHSAWRVGRLPEGDLLPFGAIHPKTTAKGEPPPVSGFLAWQLGLDIDSQAGYGMVVDRVSQPSAPRTRTATIPQGNEATEVPLSAALFTTGKTKTGPSDAAGSFDAESGVYTSTISGKPTPIPPSQATGQVPSTQEKPQAKPGDGEVVFAVAGEKGYGPISVGTPKDKHHIDETPDKEPVNAAHWNVRAPINGDDFDAPAETAGLWRPTRDGGPLWQAVLWRYDPDSNHPFLGGTREGLRRWQVNSLFDVPPPPRQKTGQDKQRDKVGGFDKLGGTDKGAEDKLGGNDKQGGTDKYGAGDTGKMPADDGGGTQEKPPSDPGIAVKTTYDDTTYVPKPGGYDKIGPKDNTAGPPTGISQGDLVYVGSTSAGADSKIGLNYTFGGAILVGDPGPSNDRIGFNMGSTRTVLQGRRYGRTPLEIAAAGLLGRPVPLIGFDLRGRADALTYQQEQAYSRGTPITSVLSAYADQTGGQINIFPGQAPGAGLYVEGAANAGGFIVLPSNVDVRILQGGGELPPDMPSTGFLCGTLSTYMGVADVTRAGVPKGGYTWSRGDYVTSSIEWWDSNGVPGGTAELPPAVVMDSGQVSVDPPPSFLVWGGQVVTVWDTTNGQAPAGTVFVADGTNAGPGGTWQDPSSLTGGNAGYFGDGSDGAATLSGGAAPAGMTFDGAITYTLSRDAFYTDLTLSGGFRLVTDGWRLYVNGTLTIGASDNINNDGAPASGATQGGAGTARTLGHGFAGGAGYTAAPPFGSNGIAGGAANPSFGGAGGAGGVAFLNTGGAGGAATAPASNFGEIRQAPQIVKARLESFQGDVALEGGAGGGSGALFLGAGAAGVSVSGGGGGGAGVVMIAAKTLINNGNITARGGPGGAATVNGGGAANSEEAGGGGGGGGGLICLVYVAAGSTLGSLLVTGGNGGAGASNFAGAPGTINGSAGASGRTRVLAL